MAPTTYEVVVSGQSFTLIEDEVRDSDFLTDALLKDGFAEGAARRVDLGNRWRSELFESLLAFIRTGELPGDGGEGSAWAGGDRVIAVGLADYLGAHSYLDALAGKPPVSQLAPLFRRDAASEGRSMRGPPLIDLVDHAIAPLADPKAKPSEAIAKRGVVVRLRDIPIRCVSAGARSATADARSIEEGNRQGYRRFFLRAPEASARQHSALLASLFDCDALSGDLEVVFDSSDPGDRVICTADVPCQLIKAAVVKQLTLLDIVNGFTSKSAAQAVSLPAGTLLARDLLLLMRVAEKLGKRQLTAVAIIGLRASPLIEHTASLL